MKGESAPALVATGSSLGDTKGKSEGLKESSKRDSKAVEEVEPEKSPETKKQKLALPAAVDKATMAVAGTLSGMALAKEKILPSRTRTNQTQQKKQRGSQKSSFSLGSTSQNLLTSPEALLALNNQSALNLLTNLGNGQNNNRSSNNLLLLPNLTNWTSMVGGGNLGHPSSFAIMEQRFSNGSVGISEYYLNQCQVACNQCGNLRYRVLESVESPIRPNRCHHWTNRENVFLTGIIMDQYYRRHSLKPSHAEKEYVLQHGKSSSKLVWRRIHCTYEAACLRYYRLTGDETPSRTIEALQKHWKETGKNNLSPEDAYTVPQSKIFECLWDNRYNTHFILTCPDYVFESLIEVVMGKKSCRCAQSGALGTAVIKPEPVYNQQDLVT